MDRLAKQLTADNAELYMAEVKSILDNNYLVADPFGRTVKAQKAVSCLIAPTIGDTVLAADAGSGGTFLLSILTRPDSTASTIALEGDVQLSVPNGKLDIAAKEGISIGTSNDLSLLADRVGLTGEVLVAAFQNLDVVGETAEAHFSDIKLFSKRLCSRIERAVQQFVTRQAKVEGLDSVNAGSIKQTAKELLNLRGMFTFMKAKKNVKIDGKQIFMG